MAVIKSPNRFYSGISAAVEFRNGQGETEDEGLIEWFASHGYIVARGRNGKTVPGGKKEKKETE